jgi:hypothetical protein
MKRSRLIFGIAVLVGLVGYGWWWQTTRNVTAHDQAAMPHLVEPTVARPCPHSAARIYVNGAGAVTLNGRAIGASDLQEVLISLKPPPAEVCLYREQMPRGELPREAMVALSAIVASRLPISSYTDGTFRTAWKI